MDMLRFHEVHHRLGLGYRVRLGRRPRSSFRRSTRTRHYHNISAGRATPRPWSPLPITTTAWCRAHFKYAAATAGRAGRQAPVLIRIETKAGHGAAKPVSKQVDEYTDMIAFLMKSLGAGPH